MVCLTYLFSLRVARNSFHDAHKKWFIVSYSNKNKPIGTFKYEILEKMRSRPAIAGSNFYNLHVT